MLGIACLLLLTATFAGSTLDPALTAPATKPYWPAGYWPKGGSLGQPGAVAVDRAAGYVYVADSGHDRVKKFTLAGELVATWGRRGYSAGEFVTPKGVAVGPDGTVYVSDMGNSRVHRFANDGSLLQMWGSYGTAAGQFHNPTGLAVDDSGNVYVADTRNDRIQKFTASGGFVTMWGSSGAESGKLDGPRGVAVDSLGNVYVADTNNQRIHKFTSTGGFVLGGWWGPIPAEGRSSSRYSSPTGVAVDGAGNVYVADSLNCRIEKCTGSGAVLASWGSAGAGNGQFRYAESVAIGSAGEAVVADTGNDRVQVLDAVGGWLATWSAAGSDPGRLRNPTDVAVDAAGNTYVADTENDRVQKYAPDGGLVTAWGSSGTGAGQFDRPKGIAVDGLGAIWVVDSGNARVQKFTSEGAHLMSWGSAGSGLGALASPRGITVDAAGRVWVADTGNNRIQSFDTSGMFLTAWGGLGSGEGSFNTPTDVGLSVSGDVYVSDSGNHRVQRFTSSGTFLGAWGGYGAEPGRFANPEGLAVLADGNVVVTDAGNNRFQEFTGSGVFVGTWGRRGDALGEFMRPSGVDGGTDGSIYIAEQLNHRVQRYRIDLEPPTTTAEGIPFAWASKAVTVTLTASDTVSGVRATYCCVGGGGSSTYAGPFSLANEGATGVEYWSVDGAGNVEPTRTATVRIDATPPSTTADGVPAGWASDVVTVTLGASDALSGVRATYYRMGGGAPTTYTVPFGVTASGTTTVEYWSADVAGNLEATRSAQVRIDRAAPASRVQGVPTGWARGSVTLTFTAEDDMSGVATTFLSRNGGVAETCTGALTVSQEGTTTLTFWSVDVAGNAERPIAASVRIDLTPPVTTPGGIPIGWAPDTVTVALSSSDTLSGVRATYYRIKGAATATYSAPIAIDEEGTTGIEYWSVDEAGNIGPAIASAVRIDRTAPVTTSDVDPAWQPRPVRVELTASDALSGVEATYYRVGSSDVRSYTAPFLVTDDGVTTVTFWSVDGAGNTEQAHSVKVRVSTKRPATNSNVGEGWHAGGFSVELEPTSAVAPVSATYYRVVGAGIEEYTGPVPMSEGTTTIEFWSVDTAGNVEETRTETVLVDASRPRTVASGVATGWVAGPSVSMVLEAQDALSGVAGTYYRLDGSEPHTYTTPVAISRPGTNTVEFWSVDAVGNAETATSVFVRMTMPVSLRLRSTASVVYWGKPATLSGVASGTAGVPVLLQTSGDGRRWVNARTLSLDESGTCSLRAIPRARTFYRLVHSARPGFSAAVSNVVMVTSRAWLTPPYLPKIAYRTRSFVAYGYLKPRHARNTWPVRLDWYHWERGRWVLRIRGSAIAGDYSTYTRYARRVTLRFAGRWRVRAYHVDAGHASTWSVYRYVWVR